MDHELRRQRIDLEEQLSFPWDWSIANYRHLDGWELNINRLLKDKFLQEMGKEFGPLTIPHRKR